MMTGVRLSDDGETLTVQIPMKLRKRGGRKLMVVPDGTSAAWTPSRVRVDSALLKAVARAHRWQRMLEIGTHDSITELATLEKMNQSYVCRVLRLTLLAPDIVEAILDGRQAGSSPTPSASAAVSRGMGTTAARVPTLTSATRAAISAAEAGVRTASRRSGGPS
jgi:hypothetical protein